MYTQQCEIAATQNPVLYIYARERLDAPIAAELRQSGQQFIIYFKTGAFAFVPKSDEKDPRLAVV